MLQRNDRKGRRVWRVKGWPVRLLAILLLIVALSHFGWTEEVLESVPAPAGLPVITVLCAPGLQGLVEQVGNRLRMARLAELQVKSAPPESLLMLSVDKKLNPDVVLTEGKDLITLLVQQGLVEKTEPVVLAADRLVLVARVEPSKPDPIRLLKNAGVGRVALPDPERTIAGVHAQAALRKIGMAKDLASRLAIHSDADAALRAIGKGAADLAIAYQSDVVRYPDLRSVMVFPERSYLPILYIGARFKNTRHPQAARSFLMMLLGRGSAQAWKTAGFSPPPLKEDM